MIQARHARTKVRNCAALARQGGWGIAEYVSVMLGLATAYGVFDLLTTMIQRHHRLFTWALMLPF